MNKLSPLAANLNKEQLNSLSEENKVIKTVLKIFKNGIKKIKYEDLQGRIIGIIHTAE